MRQHRSPQSFDDQGGSQSGRAVVLFQGAVDIGQGANTVISQICADAVGVPLESVIRVGADTDTTPDAGKTSASRQTFVSGNAAFAAGQSLRRQLLGLVGASTIPPSNSTARAW